MLISRASLRVYSESLNLSEIIGHLGEEPCFGHSLGDSRPRKPEKKFEETLWSKRSSLSEEQELVVHLSHLLDFMDEKKDIFMFLKRYCEMDFFCYLGSESGQGGMVIPSNISKRFSEFDMNLVLDIYLTDDE